MVTESKIDTLFDYNSVFEYDSITPLSKGVSRSFYKSAFTYHSVNIESDSDADKREDEHWMSSVVRSGITVLVYLLVFLSFPLSFWICVKKVHALERIVLMRLGKLQAIRGPGFSLVLPVIDTWKRVDLRPQTFTVSSSQLLTADGAIVELKSDFEYQVCDVTSYVMKLSEQQRSLEELGTFCLKNLVSEKDQDDLENKIECISSSLKNELNQASLRWGLEVLHVYLYSLNILKPAEPVDALGTLMIALKAATGDSTPNATTVYPGISDDIPQKQASVLPKNSFTILEQSEEPSTPVLDVLKNTISSAEEKGLLNEVTANFKFDIVGNSTKTIYITLENGHASIFEEPFQELSSDVSLLISEDNLREFLFGKLSPLEAYMEGKVMVTGDWTLLRPLAKILEH